MDQPLPGHVGPSPFLELGEFVKEFRPTSFQLTKNAILSVLKIAFGLAAIALLVFLTWPSSKGSARPGEFVGTIFVFLMFGGSGAMLLVLGVIEFRTYLRALHFSALQYRYGFIFVSGNKEETVLFRDVAVVYYQVREKQMPIAGGGIALSLPAGESHTYRIECRDGRVVDVSSELVGKASTIGVILKNFQGEHGYRWMPLPRRRFWATKSPTTKT